MEMATFMNEVPKYAILSHRWGDDEVSFQDYHDGGSPKRAAYQKVQQFSTCAKGYGMDWMWIDTCCIDKTSSAELSETINSMYQYYQQASVCIAYLFDVTGECCRFACDPLCPKCDKVCEEFELSEYFKRGWTLQELIGPFTVSFFNKDWHCIGLKAEDDRLSLLGRIETVTNIPINVLLHPHEVQRQSLAQRLSWAAKRKTTRREDEAYSLFGLLQVNLPLLYGEGHRAWKRLMEELVRVSNDESIFMGVTSDLELLPGSVAGYASCADIRRSHEVIRGPYTITNQGLEMRLGAGSAMTLPHLNGPIVGEVHMLAIQLNCWNRPRNRRQVRRPCFLVLMRLPDCNHYMDVTGSELLSTGRASQPSNWSPCASELIYIHIWNEQNSGCLFPSFGSNGAGNVTNDFEAWVSLTQKEVSN